MGPTYWSHLSLGNAGASNPKSQIGFFFFPADPHNSVGRGCVSRTVTDRALSCATPFDLLPGFHLTVPRDGTPRAFHGCWQGSAWSLASERGVCRAGDAWSCSHHACPWPWANWFSVPMGATMGLLRVTCGSGCRSWEQNLAILPEQGGCRAGDAPSAGLPEGLQPLRGCKRVWGRNIKYVGFM